MFGEECSDLIAHVHSRGAGAKYADRVRLGLQARQGGRRQRDGQRVLGRCPGVLDCQLRPCFVYRLLKKTQTIDGLDGQVLGHKGRVAWLVPNQHILAVEPEAFARDLSDGNLNWQKRLDGIDEKLRVSNVSAMFIRSSLYQLGKVRGGDTRSRRTGSWRQEAKSPHGRLVRQHSRVVFS